MIPLMIVIFLLSGPDAACVTFERVYETYICLNLPGGELQ